MTYALICIAALALLAIAAAIANRYSSGPDNVAVAQSDCGTCDGTNTKCEQECMLEAAVKPIEYFDDEELDQFAGRPSDRYSDEEAEQFRDVLYTMRPEEAPQWSRSLNLRGIAPPDQIKDELIMMIG